MIKSGAKFLQFQKASSGIDRRYRIADNKEVMVLEAVFAAYIDAKFFFYVLIALFGLSGNLYAQSSKGNAVACYEEVIKEPAIFYGNPGETFTLYDGTRWRVLAGGSYEYVPMRYKDITICPAMGKLMNGNRMIPVVKLNN